MKNLKIIILSLFALYAMTGIAQTDEEMREEILNYENHNLILENGRELLWEYFLDGNVEKVDRILAFLLDNVGEHYEGFRIFEEHLLYFYTGRYEDILSSELKDGMAVVRSYSDTLSQIKSHIRPPTDRMYREIKTSMNSISNDIRAEILASTYSQEDKDFLELYFERLKYASYSENYTSAFDKINVLAKEYKEKYPDSKHNIYSWKNGTAVYELNDWSGTANLGGGPSLFSGTLDDTFKTGYQLGLEMDAYYKRLNLNFKLLAGGTKNRDSLVVDEVTWLKNTELGLTTVGLAVGCVIIDSELFKITPTVGMATFNLIPTTDEQDDYPEYKESGIKFITSINFGGSLDVKLGGNNYYYSNDFYPYIRLRYGYSMLQYPTKYDMFDGDMQSFSISYGFYVRGSHRVYDEKVESEKY